MKTRKMSAALLALLYCIMLFTGCASNAGELYDSGVTNQQVYQTFDTWKYDDQSKIEVRLVVDVTVNREMLTVDEEITAEADKTLPKSKERVIQRLRMGIVDFFQERYNIDVSEKIEKQEIAIFSATGNQAGVMGFVDIYNPNCLNLNEKLFSEYSERMETTYIHETLHQLGFRSESTLVIEEGITDALTDMICCYIGIKQVLTTHYSECRTVGYQLLAADPEIVSCYLEEDAFDIICRINEKLEGVSQPFKESKNLGKRLESRLEILLNIATGNILGLSTDPYWFAFEAQEIVKAYCQVCDPNETTIGYIRAHYLVIDYESVKILEDENGYYVK